MDIRKIVVAASLTAIMAVAILPGCIQQPEENVDGYAAVVPAAFRSGASQNVQVSLFNGTSPASGQVQIALMKDGKELATAARCHRTSELGHLWTVQNRPVQAGG